MTRPMNLKLEPMEDRSLPAIFGIPWLSSDVTVGIAPDGTSVDGVKSSLLSTLAGDGLSATQMTAEIQRAFQAWSSATNLNFGFVADGGQAVGTPGRIQDDTRFGDIRILGRPLGNYVLAITVPPGVTSETRAGDIILNTEKDFGINPAVGSGRYDLFTVMLQEVGHAVGVGNNTDISSAMFETYRTTRTELSAVDRTAVQKLYSGARKADGFEGVGGNATTSSAAALNSTVGTTTLLARGDIVSSGDVDTYSFVAPKSKPKSDGATIRLGVAGLSLLAAKLELLDSKGTVLAGTTTVAPQADLQLTSNSLVAGTRYFVRVTAPAISNFRSGGYDLRVVFDSTAADPGAVPVPTVVVDGGTNNTLASATVPAALPGSTAQTFHRIYGQIESSSDVDNYRITAPVTTDGKTTTLSIQIASYREGSNTGGLANLVEVYDRNGRPVPLEDLSYSSFRKSFQLRNVPSGASYTIAVKQNGLLADRNYELTAYFSSAATVNYAVTDTRILNAANAETFSTLKVNQAQVFTILVESKSIGTGFPSLVFMDVIDSEGRTVQTIFGAPGVNYGTSVFLLPGEYTLRKRAPFSGSSNASLEMTLKMDALTDPIGLKPPVDASLTPDANAVGIVPVETFELITTYDILYYAWLG